MQASGPTSPARDTAAATGSSPGGAPSYPGRRRDPLTYWLIVAVFAVILLFLAGVLSALMFGVFNISGAPRTAVERDLRIYGAQAQSGKATSHTVAQYVAVLVRAGELSKAQTTLDQAFASIKADRSYLFAEQAQLYNTQSRYADAVKAADKAMSEANGELAAIKKKNLANKRAENAGAVLPDSYATAALAKATALISLKNVKDAIKAYDAYLVASPTDADVLVARAEAKTTIGDKAGAASDYRAALKFIPDYQAALDGLKKIGASK